MEKSENSVSGDDSARPWHSYDTVYTTAKAGLFSRCKISRLLLNLSHFYLIETFFKDFIMP